MNKLYRKKYIIGIYEYDEYLFALLNNEYEFADFFNININNARSTLSDLFNNKIHFIKYKGKRLNVYFILDIEES